MKKEDKYHFNDFTEKNYRRLLKIAKKNYIFKDFQNYLDVDSFIIWRHDVDYSVNRAKKIAMIDKEEGIQSTFFFLLHSESYNLLEKEIHNLVLEIIEMGHHIGLHFDVHFYGHLNEFEFKKVLLLERQILEKFFSVKVKAFSFHNPTPKILKLDNEVYQGMKNTYNSFLKKNVDYISDSNGYWRYERLEDVLRLKRPKKLQVLTHPEWWQKEPMSPFKRITRSIEGRLNKTFLKYKDHLKKYQRKNIN